MATTRTLQLGIDARGMKTGSTVTVAALAKIAKGALAAVAAIKAFQIAISLTRELAEFDRKLSILAAVMGKTREEIAPLTALIKDLGATTEFTASQVGQASVEFARAGFTLKETMDALASSLDLATVAELSVADAANITATTLRQFNLSARQTGRVMDVLARQANSAATTVGQMSEGLKFAGTVSNALGVSLEDTAAAMGVLATNAGVRGTLAGTQLRQIMLQLINPTRAARDTFERLGVGLEEVDVVSKGLIPVLQRLKAAGVGAGEASSIFGIRPTPGALTLIRNISAVRAASDANKQAQDTAKDMAGVIRDDLKAAIDELASAWEAFKLSIINSDKAIAVLKAAAEFIRPRDDKPTTLVGGVGTESEAVNQGVFEENTRRFMGEQGIARLKEQAALQERIAEANKTLPEDRARVEAANQARAQEEQDIRKVMQAEMDRRNLALTFQKEMEQAQEKRIQLAKIFAEEGVEGLNAIKEAQDKVDEAQKRGLTNAQALLPIFFQIALAGEKAAAEIVKSTEKTEDLASSFDEAGTAVLNGLGNALVDLVFEFENLEDAAKQTLQAIVKELFRVLVVKQLVGAAGGALGLTTNADGNAFGGGRVIPFARGGVVDGPTLFPMANGVGLMGEAGPEAVMPLERGPDGKLGVKSQGGGSTINQTFNIVTPDANSFRRSERQIRDRMRNVATGRTA